LRTAKKHRNEWVEVARQTKDKSPFYSRPGLSPFLTLAWEDEAAAEPQTRESVILLAVQQEFRSLGLDGDFLRGALIRDRNKPVAPNRSNLSSLPLW